MSRCLLFRYLDIWKLSDAPCPRGERTFPPSHSHHLVVKFSNSKNVGELDAAEKP